MTVKVYAPDLMDRSKIAAAKPDAVFVKSAAELDDADLAVVDLSRAGVLETVSTLNCGRIVGFGAHVERELLRDAATQGVDLVLTRREFFGRLNELLSN